MYFQDEETQRIVQLIRSQSMAWTRKELESLKVAAAKQRAIGLDATSRAIAIRYEGDQTATIVAKLKERYPNGWRDMPTSTLRYVRQWAATDAGCYHEPALRFLVDDVTGQKLPTEDPRAELFASLMRDVKVDVVMPEVERRCLSGAASCAVFVGWRQVTQRPSLQLYWPHDVLTLTHPEGYDDPAYLIAVALRQGQLSPDGHPVWWVWSRPYEDSDAGPVFGAWSHAKVSDGGEAVLAEPYEGTRLPIVFARTRLSDGYFFPRPDDTVPELADDVNIARINELHVVNRQAHSVPVISGQSYDERRTPLSPDVVLALQSGERLEFATPAADFPALLASREQTLREIAVSKGVNPSAYSSEQGGAESGVSRMIANIPHERRLRELRPMFEALEEQDLLPTILDVHDSFHATASIGEGVTPRVLLAQPVTYEDPEALQRRLLVDLEQGVISKARYAVELGHYQTIEDAVAAGLSDDLAGSTLGTDGIAAAMLQPAEDGIDVNQLTLGIERLGRLGDTDGLNLLRQQLAAKLGSTIADVSAPELASDAAPIAEATGATRRTP